MFKNIQNTSFFNSQDNSFKSNSTFFLELAILFFIPIKDHNINLH